MVWRRRDVSFGKLTIGREGSKDDGDEAAIESENARLLPDDSDGGENVRIARRGERVCHESVLDDIRCSSTGQGSRIVRDTLERRRAGALEDEPGRAPSQKAFALMPPERKVCVG